MNLPRGSGSADGLAYGGRVETWVTDNVRVGVTGMAEETGAVNQNCDWRRCSVPVFLKAHMQRWNSPKAKDRALAQRFRPMVGCWLTTKLWPLVTDRPCVSKDMPT